MGLKGERKQLAKERDDALERVKALEAALSFYADRGGYSDKPVEGKPFFFDPAKCVRDGGKIARRALQEGEQ